MIWRLYYTIKEAAEELSKHFNESYSANDIVHYGANNIVRLCLNNLVPAHLEKVFVARISEFDEDFISVNNDKIIKNQAIIDGSGIIKPDFIVIPSRYLQVIEKFPKDTFSLNRVSCLISNNELIYPAPSHVISNEIGLLGIDDIKWDFCIFPHLNLDMLDKFMNRNYFLIDELDYHENFLNFSIDDLYITACDFDDLKKNIKGKLNTSLKKNSSKTTNKQAEIIAALAVLFTKTNDTRPYEMAETILQEWQRNTDKIGRPPSKETLAKYISDGLDRIKP